MPLRSSQTNKENCPTHICKCTHGQICKNRCIPEKEIVHSRRWEMRVGVEARGSDILGNFESQTRNSLGNWQKEGLYFPQPPRSLCSKCQDNGNDWTLQEGYVSGSQVVKGVAWFINPSA